MTQKYWLAYIITEDTDEEKSEIEFGTLGSKEEAGDQAIALRKKFEDVNPDVIKVHAWGVQELTASGAKQTTREDLARRRYVLFMTNSPTDNRYSEVTRRSHPVLCIEMAVDLLVKRYGPLTVAQDWFRNADHELTHPLSKNAGTKTPDAYFVDDWEMPDGGFQ